MATLVISKRDVPEQAVVDRDFRYEIRLVNLGPDTATDVVVTDLVPESADVISTTPTFCLVQGRLVTCNLVDIGPGQTRTVVIVVRPTTPGVIVNAVTAQGTNTNLATAAEQTDVVGQTTLQILKSDSPDPAFVFGRLTYRITVTNAGDTTAFDVLLEDILPPGVTFLSASVPCTVGPTLRLRCPLGDILPLNSATVEIVVIPFEPGTVLNQVSASGSNTNVARTTTETRIIQAADLAVTKTAPAFAQVNQGLTYTITVRNNGPSTATGVTLVDTLPADVRFIRATPSQGTCTRSGRTLTCQIGTLAPGKAVTVQVLVVPTAPGPITNTAVVSGNEFDPNPENNTASATVTVNQCSPAVC